MIRTLKIALYAAAIVAAASPALAQYSTIRCAGTVCHQMVCAANGSYCKAVSTFYRADPYDRGNSSAGYDALFPNGARPNHPICDSQGQNCH